MLLENHARSTMQFCFIYLYCTYGVGPIFDVPGHILFVMCKDTTPLLKATGDIWDSPNSHLITASRQDRARIRIGSIDVEAFSGKREWQGSNLSYIRNTIVKTKQACLNSPFPDCEVE